MSSLIWNGTVQHSLRRLNTSPLRSLRSSGHASSPDTRSFKSFVHSPSLPRTSGSSFLKSSHRLHGGVHAGGISLRINGRICYDTNRPCCIIAKYRITLLYGAGYWQVNSYFSTDIDTHDFTLCDWFWVVKHTPRLWNHCPCQDQFTKPMWWSILFSSAELLTACPCLDQFSDEDWRRLNILPKLRGRLHTSNQFRKLVELTKHPSRHLEFDNLSL